MRRRNTLSLIGSACLWPLATRSQPSTVRQIGFIGTTSSTAWRQQVAAFDQRLRELGWAPGRTIAIDYRWTEGREDKAREAAEALVARKVELIVVGGNAVAATKRVTTSIPIVFPVAIDPVGAGFVENLARPGGNVTGLSLQGTDLAGKRVELLRKAIPALHRLAVMGNLDYAAATKEMTECQAAARALGLEPVALPIKRAEDIEAAFAARRGAEALYVVTDALVNNNVGRIAELALKARLPTMLGAPDELIFGGLMAYGPKLVALFRRAAEYVDKILRGTKPGDLPVEQPSRFELVINLKTAKALGLAIPADLLASADEVIE
jgi:putative ABC transport system substrate-binding protein